MSGDLTGLHVLVVEDDQDVLELICRHLEDVGCRVTAAQSGEDGVRLALADPPNAALVDLMLPMMNGHEVLAALRGDERTRDAYLIVSSVLDAQDRATAAADATLAKPFRRDALIAALRPALARAAGR